MKTKDNKTYGLFGGTFDPIHIGHLFIAEEIRKKYKLDKIVFIPTGNPPHKKKVTNKDDRCKMVEIAINKNKNFVISNIETNTIEKNYTLDTIKKLKIEYPDKKFKFIVGLDSLNSIHTWKEYKELLNTIEFIAISRQGYNMVKKNELENVDIINTININISSTEIRKRIKNKMNIKYLVPYEVEEYIKEKNIYK